MKSYLLAGMSIVLVALVIPGSSLARSASANGTTVRVTAKDFAFALSRKTVPRGQVTFVIRNVSPAQHNFAIAGRVSKTIARGRTTTLTLRLKRGRYSYRCTVDGHADLGMKGVLRVM